MLCKIVVAIFVFLYVLALGVYLTGTYGWFGQNKDPLSGIFLLPLGMPWTLVELGDQFNRYVALLSPLLNATILWIICRYFAKMRAG
jgi:hypothetical protein